MEDYTLLFAQVFLDLQLDDFFRCGQVVHNLDFLIFYVERSDHFGDFGNGDQLADLGVEDRLEDVVLDVSSEVKAKLCPEDGIDLGLVDELITDSLEVLKEVLSDIDFVMLLVVGVRVELFKARVAGVALRVGVLAVVAASLLELDGLADGKHASESDLGSHGGVQGLVFLFNVLLNVGYIRAGFAEKTGIIGDYLAQNNINPRHFSHLLN